MIRILSVSTLLLGSALTALLKLIVMISFDINNTFIETCLMVFFLALLTCLHGELYCLLINQKREK